MVKDHFKKRPLRIAILGTRGIPARYGGFETFVQELSTRLCRRGHKVTVYGRTHYVPEDCTEYRGVKLVRLPAVRHKYLDTVSNTVLATFHCLGGRYDVALFCNAVNAFVCWLPRLTGTRVALNVDGIERRRSKWNRAGKAVYLISERLATWLPNRIIADARTIQSYYRSRYGADSTFIPYGAEPAVGEKRSKILDQLGLQPGRYLLYVSRLEPENNAHLLMEAYLASRAQLPLVVVGDAPYSDDYIAGLRASAEKGRILMPGAIYGADYRSLMSHCLCYFQATEVGGTHPALLEGMALAPLVAAHDNDTHREVLAEAGLYCNFRDKRALASLIDQVVEATEQFSNRTQSLRDRVASHYNWDFVTTEYERLFYRLLSP